MFPYQPFVLMKLKAEIAAVAPSPAADANWDTEFCRMSPTAYSPATGVSHRDIDRDVTGVVHLDQVAHQGRVRFKSHVHEQPGKTYYVLGVGNDVSRPYGGNGVLAEHFLHHRIPDDLNLPVVEEPVLDRLVRPATGPSGETRAPGPRTPST